MPHPQQTLFLDSSDGVVCDKDPVGYRILPFADADWVAARGLSDAIFEDGSEVEQVQQH